MSSLRAPLVLLVLLVTGCPALPPEDGCAAGYADGYDLGWSHGEVCYSPEGSVQCSDEGLDYCDFAAAYDHCFGVAFLDGFAAAERVFEDCDVEVSPCGTDLGQCVGG